MNHCKFCGEEIGQTSFCPHCGKPQNAEVPQHTGGKRLHCPHCRSKQLTAIVEQGETNGTATHTRMTGGIGVTSYKATTVNRHYWMCRECGHKFRNLENLNTELASTQWMIKRGMTGAVVMAVFCLVLLALLKAEPMLLLFVIVPLVVCAALVVYVLALCYKYKKKADRLESDKAYLETHCFD